MTTPSASRRSFHGQAISSQVSRSGSESVATSRPAAFSFSSFATMRLARSLSNVPQRTHGRFVLPSTVSVTRAHQPSERSSYVPSRLRAMALSFRCLLVAKTRLVLAVDPPSHDDGDGDARALVQRDGLEHLAFLRAHAEHEILSP